ncbi:hypothetical protein PM082_006571 [Marasmius tenuissimus]|nr:hypothetical protein PM082_006571 [Marasmius tenuissimus]
MSPRHATITSRPLRYHIRLHQLFLEHHKLQTGTITPKHLRNTRIVFTDIIFLASPAKPLESQSVISALVRPDNHTGPRRQLFSSHPRILPGKSVGSRLSRANWVWK